MTTDLPGWRRHEFQRAWSAIDWKHEAKRERRRMLRQLPWRTRLRLALRRPVDLCGCWLADHVHWRAAMWFWRAVGTWR